MLALKGSLGEPTPAPKSVESEVVLPGFLMKSSGWSIKRALPFQSCVCGGHLQNGKPVRRKNPGKMGEKWKMAPGLKWPKNGHRNGKKTEKKWPKAHFWGEIFAISGRGPLSIFSPIFPGFLRRTGFPFCRWPPHTQFTSRTQGSVSLEVL